MATLQEYVQNTLNHPQYQNAPYKEQIAVRQGLFDTIAKYDKNFQKLNIQEQSNARREFTTQLPDSVRTRIENDQTQEGQEAQERITRMDEMRTTGEDKTNFVDGGMSVLQNTRSIATRFAQVIYDNYAMPLWGVEQPTEMSRRESQSYQDANTYMDMVASSKKGSSYTWGKRVMGAVGFIGDAALAGSLYGSVGSPGVLTRWIPQVTSNMTTRSAMIAGYSMQAAVESLGFVAEDLGIDLAQGRFDDPAEWSQWVKEIPSDAGRGLAFMILGEMAGGFIGTAARGSMLGIKGLSKHQSIMAFNKLAPEAKYKRLMDAIGSSDDELMESAAKHMDAIDPGSGTKWLNSKKNLDYLEQNKFILDDEQTARFVLSDLYDAKFKDDVLIGVGDVKLAKTHTIRELMDNPRLLREVEIKVTKNQLETSAKMFADRQSRIKVDYIVKGNVKKTSLSVHNAIDTFVPSDGKVVLKRAQTYLDAVTGKTGNKLKAVMSDDFYNFGARHTSPDTISIPRTVKDVDQADFFQRSFHKQLADVGITAKKAGNTDLSAYIKSVRTSKWALQNIKQLDGVEKLVQGADGTTSLTIKGQEFKFNNLDDAGDYAHLVSIKPADMQARVAQDFGLEIKQTDAGGWQLSSGKQLIGEGKDLTELMMTNRQYAPLMPNRFAPEFIPLGNKEIGATIIPGKGNTIDSALNGMKKFEKQWDRSVGARKPITKTTSGGNRITLDPVDRAVRVTLGDSGITRTFNTPAEARSFLRKDMSVFKNLQTELLDPLGLEVRTTPVGHYVLFGDAVTGMNKRTFKTVQALRKYVGDLDKQGHFKDLSGLKPHESRALSAKYFEEMGEYTKQAEANFKKGNSGLMKAISLKSLATRYTNTVRRVVDRIGDPGMAKAYHGLESMDKVTRVEVMNITNSYRSITKNLNVQQRTEVGWVLAHEAGARETWEETAKRLKIDWTPQHAQAAQATMEGFRKLGMATGVKPEEAINFYFTRLREINESAVHEWDTASVGRKHKILDPSGHKFKDLDFWAEHLRQEDLHAGKIHLDIDTVFLAYTRVGMRKKYLQEPLRAFADAQKNLAKSNPGLPPEVFNRLNAYENSVAGRFVNQGQADRFMRRVARNVRLANKFGYEAGVLPNQISTKNMGKAEKALNLSLASQMGSLQTSALMSFKLFIPLRNVLQSNFLGAFYDNPQVIRAMDDIIKGDTGAFYDEAFAKNLLGERTLVGDKKQFLPFTKNWNLVGTQWLKNSDDWNRIVAMRTVQRATDESWGLLQRGKIDIPKFMNRTNASLLDADQLPLFMKHLEAGDVDGMKSIMERHMVYQTHFDYNRSQKPEWLQSEIGTIAGSYSTYPMQFGEMLAKGLKAKGPMFGLKLTANMMAVAYLYNDILGIEGVEGNPIKVLGYMGGPLLTSGADFANTMAQTIGSARDQSTIKAAGERLLSGSVRAGAGLSRVTVPMAWYPKRFSKGLESLHAGEYTASMMSFMGLNVNEESLVNQLSLDDIESIFSGE